MRELHGFALAAPIGVALVWILLNSLWRDPDARRRFNAVVVAGAGAAYLSGGFGPWELAFATLATAVAYRGLTSWGWIGVAWLLHTAWDVLHHRYGNVIIPFAPTSSFGCAICDPALAVWCFAGGPSVATWIRRRTAGARGGAPYASPVAAAAD